MVSKNPRRRRDQRPEPAQQVGAALDPLQRIVVSDLKSFAQISDRQTFQYLAINPQRLVRSGGEQSAREHVEAREREALRTADLPTGCSIAITPRWPGSGIEQDTHDREIELGARPSVSIRPMRRVRNCRPTILAASHEMAPTRMKRNVEGRIIIAHRR